jgi:hypothetical protein
MTAKPSDFFSFPNGDITLHLHNATDPANPLSLTASSAALSLASPIWKKFLYPPWSPSPGSPQPVPQLDFTSDTPSALAILLRIAHLQFRRVPKSMCYSQLLQIAILCDQYACVDLVQPWLESWLADEKTVSMEEGQEGWLFIAWVFERESIFEELAKKLVFEIKTNKEGQCLTRNGVVMPEPMPNGIIGEFSLQDAMKPKLSKK